MTQRPAFRAPRPFVWVGCLFLLGMACGGRAESTRAGSDSAGSNSQEYAAPPGTGGTPTTRQPKQPTAPAPIAGTFGSAPIAGTVGIAGTFSSAPTPSPSDFGGTFSGPSPTGGASGVSGGGGNGGVAGLPPYAAGGENTAGGESAESDAGAASDCLRCNQAFSQSSLKVCANSLLLWQAMQQCMCAPGPLGCDSKCAAHAMCSHVDGGGLAAACGPCLEQCRAAEAACEADF